LENVNDDDGGGGDDDVDISIVWESIRDNI
jgi:hypothetical protein